jgi:hypothetical protein
MGFPPAGFLCRGARNAPSAVGGNVGEEEAGRPRGRRQGKISRFRRAY